MLQRPVLVTPPGATPWTLAELKAHLRVDGNDEDNLITALLAAAVGYLDGYAGVLGRCLINQVWRQSFGRFDRYLRLPFPDVSTVTLKYFDSDNTEQTISDPALYQLLEDPRGSYLRLSSTFATPVLYSDRRDPIGVLFTAGYGAEASDVPAAIRQAILLLVAHWYGNREAVGENTEVAMPLAVNVLLAPYRRVGL